MDIMTGLSIGSGIAQGLDNAVKNFINISTAKTKLEQEKSIFGIEKKQKELEIKKLEFALDPEQIQLAKDSLKAETNAKKAEFTLNIMKTEQALSAEGRKITEHEKAMQTLDNILKTGQGLPRGVSVNVGGVTARGVDNESSSAVVGRILGKKERGEMLNAGEQEIYDGYIKKSRGADADTKFLDEVNQQLGSTSPIQEVKKGEQESFFSLFE